MIFRTDLTNRRSVVEYEVALRKVTKFRSTVGRQGCSSACRFMPGKVRRMEAWRFSNLPGRGSKMKIFTSDGSCIHLFRSLLTFIDRILTPHVGSLPLIFVAAPFDPLTLGLFQHSRFLSVYIYKQYDTLDVTSVHLETFIFSTETQTHYKSGVGRLSLSLSLLEFKCFLHCYRKNMGRAPEWRQQIFSLQYCPVHYSIYRHVLSNVNEELQQ